MREQYSKFDCELLKNDFLKRHHECLPFIGEDYDNCRLLLIGESHYVPDDEDKRGLNALFAGVSRFQTNLCLQIVQAVQIITDDYSTFDVCRLIE